MLRGLPREWDAKATAIEEALGFKNVKLEEIMGKLLSHEDKMNQDTKGEPSKKKGIALAVEEEVKEEPKSLGVTTEEISLIVKGLREIGKWKPKEKTQSKVTCYKCQGIGHLKKDCPRNLRREKKAKKGDC